MNPIARILVPTDFSDTAAPAIEYALQLAQRVGASVLLLHVYEIPISYPEGHGYSAEMMRALEEGANATLTGALTRWKERARAIAGDLTPVSINGKVLTGPTAFSITEEARLGNYDLIVMGTHGRTGLARWMIGSVAERVVRTAGCPVLTVRGDTSRS